jgi:hypothetical protein
VRPEHAIAEANCRADARTNILIERRACRHSVRPTKHTDQAMEKRNSMIPRRLFLLDGGFNRPNQRRSSAKKAARRSKSCSGAAARWKTLADPNNKHVEML